MGLMEALELEVAQDLVVQLEIEEIPGNLETPGQVDPQESKALPDPE